MLEWDEARCRDGYNGLFDGVLEELRVRFRRVAERTRTKSEFVDTAQVKRGLEEEEGQERQSEGVDSIFVSSHVLSELRKGRDGAAAHYLKKNVIVFDWDDTVLATTSLFTSTGAIGGSRRAAKYALEQLGDLDAVAVDLFELAQRLGRVLVITNSGCGWVEESSAKFLPQLHEFFAKNHIDVISARDKFSTSCPDSPSEWKTRAMKEQLIHENARCLNVMVFGDCYSDQYAAHAVKRTLENSTDMTMKFVKLAAKPTIQQLVDELTLLKRSIARMVSSGSSFDIRIAG